MTNPVEVSVDALASGGAGVARHDGKVMFIDGACPGDRLQVEIYKSTERFDKARIVKILEASPDRAIPPCPIFDRCGGCQWQHVLDKRQFEEKTLLALETLRRIGGLEPEQVEHFASPQPFSTRIRARLHATPDGRLGFFSPLSHRVVPFDLCMTLHPDLNFLLSAIKAVLASERLPLNELEAGWSSLSNQGALHLMVRRAVRRERLEKIMQKIPELAGIIATGAGKPVRAGKSALPLPAYNRPDGLSHDIRSFWQAHSNLNVTAQTYLSDQLQAAAKEGLSLKKAVEFFSGSGNLSAILSDHANELVLIESDPVAQREARRNLDRKKDVIDFRTETAQQAIRDLTEAEHKTDIVLLDPPRAGFKDGAELLPRLDAQLVLYQSCNPATLARDLQPLAAAGYTLKSVAFFDFFPQTYHLESIAVLHKVR